MSVCLPAFIGYDNWEDVQLQDDSVEDGVFADTNTAGVTAIDVVIEGITYDYATYSSNISWDDDGKVSVQFGRLVTTAGKKRGYFVLKDPTMPNGLRWYPDFLLTVFEAPAA